MRPAAIKNAAQDSGRATEWGRGRLLAMLTAAGVVAALLLGGVGYAAYLALTGISEDANATPGVATGETDHPTVGQGAARREEIAAAPMLTVPQSAAFPADTASEASQSGPTIKIPAGTGLNGPGFVMTGFPHTPEGAIGQLAQIDTAVLQSMSLPTAHEVYRTWALPGGVNAEDWWITASVRAFLTSTDMGEVKDPSASVTLEPAAALVKGTDGPDWAVVCVLMKVTATYQQEAQIAFYSMATSSGEDVPRNIEDIAVEKKLNEPVTLNMADQSLDEAMTFLRNYTGLNVVLDPKALSEEGLSKDSKVNLQVNSIKLKTALKFLLRPLGPLARHADQPPNPLRHGRLLDEPELSDVAGRFDVRAVLRLAHEDAVPDAEDEGGG